MGVPYWKHFLKNCVFYQMNNLIPARQTCWVLQVSPKKGVRLTCILPQLFKEELFLPNAYWGRTWMRQCLSHSAALKAHSSASCSLFRGLDGCDCLCCFEFTGMEATYDITSCWHVLFRKFHRKMLLTKEVDPVISFISALNIQSSLKHIVCAQPCHTKQYQEHWCMHNYIKKSTLGIPSTC